MHKDTQAGQCLVARLRAIVGRAHVLTSASSTRRYRTGIRFGSGPALAVVRPGSLVEQWRVLQACMAANAIVIVQAANTGLTGGSTPDGDDYDREIVIVSTLRIARVHLIDGGRQAVCLPGATLFQLEKMLRPIGREPHCLIGSSCIGASVFGGVCNNSGGSLIHRGPVFTQLTLFARVDQAGRLELVNHLGIELGSDPETILERVERGGFAAEEIAHPADRVASDQGYEAHVRAVDEPTPARFNADPHRLFECAGSAGKVMIFAVRLDTFERDARTAVFYIGSNDTQELEEVRRHMLGSFRSLPVSGEYIHRNAYRIAETYGKDTFLAIRHLGTDRLPALFALKGRFDALAARLPFLPHDLSDRVMQAVASLFPPHLPKRMTDYHRRFEHHLIVKMAGDGIEEARSWLSQAFPTASGAFFECSADEGEKAMLHRFAVAGGANRYRAIHRKEVQDILALDIALRRNDRDWFESLPPEIDRTLEQKIYYGHFFCHVLHQEYIVRKGHDPVAIEHAMWKLLDGRGAEYPAEHDVGHLYNAKPALVAHFRSLDPCNCFNPGVGRTSKLAHWK
ncbi:MAG: D-lactate dehydrogenase [Reyranella sp.]|nr:D-lactate dehydrogenase [Reyranella sp.]MBL6652805.1 D-lactate dehydrogenase [Reyranella sp.]